MWALGSSMCLCTRSPVHAVRTCLAVFAEYLVVQYCTTPWPGCVDTKGLAQGSSVTIFIYNAGRFRSIQFFGMVLTLELGILFRRNPSFAAIFFTSTWLYLAEELPLPLKKSFCSWILPVRTTRLGSVPCCVQETRQTYAPGPGVVQIRVCTTPWHARCTHTRTTSSIFQVVWTTTYTLDLLRSASWINP